MRKSAELIYENTFPGIFLKRNNRFTAQVLIDGQEETVHVKNTGRLGELLVPERKVTLQRSCAPGRKTAYDLISVYKPVLKWVNIDSLAPNALTKMWLEQMDYDLVRPEYKYGDSRIDFYMERGDKKFLTEVKGCTLADPGQRGFGLFPDAPTQRGVKHLRELTKAVGEGYRCSIYFVIQMNSVHIVKPNFATDPEFGDALIDAARAGVTIVSFGCHVEADRIKITGNADYTSVIRNLKKEKTK